MTKAEFLSIFEGYPGLDSARLFFAPGRLNLIGEHTDYNGGHVFPCALSMGTYCALIPRDDRRLCLYSADFPSDGVIHAELDAPSQTGLWADYALGVTAEFSKRGFCPAHGFDLLIAGDIPAGAGLSSSASLELAVAYAISCVFDFDIPLPELALCCQSAENSFVGVSCGIMDQFASAMGREGQAIFLDTSTLEYEYAPLDMRGLCLVIMDTRSPRTLAGSAYNARRAECEAACTALGVTALGELTNEELAARAHAITDAIIYRRARHAVSENIRTVEALRCLKNGDMHAFGNLMNLSHASLRDDYEVTGSALDAIVEAARKQPGVLGARMTGAGFGGCAVALVESDKLESFRSGTAELYRASTGLEPRFYTALPSSGPREL